jgi:hypothetical protein
VSFNTRPSAHGPVVKGVLVGREGPWITAAAGVLYAANLRKSTTAGSPYRFSCSPSALGVLTRIHGSLAAGEVPEDVTADDFAKVDFQMDFPDGAVKRLNPFGKGKNDPELTMGVVTLEESGSGLKPAASGFGALLDCTVVLIHARVPGPSGPRSAVGEDAALASVVESVARGRRGAAPGVCVQWWLPAPPPEPKPAKEGEEPAPPAIPPTNERAARDKLGAEMLEGFLPRTAAALTALRAAAPSSFFAWLKPEKGPRGIRVARRQLFDVGGVEAEYPYEELTALIDHLGRLAA